MSKQSLLSEVSTSTVSVSRLLEIFTKAKKVVLKGSDQDTAKYNEAVSIVRTCLANSKMPVEVLKEEINTFQDSIAQAITNNETLTEYVLKQAEQNDYGCYNLVGRYLALGSLARVSSVLQSLALNTDLNFSRAASYFSYMISNKSLNVSGSYLCKDILQSMAAIIDNGLKTTKNLASLIQAQAIILDHRADDLNYGLLSDIYLLLVSKVANFSKNTLLLVPSHTLTTLL